MTVRRPPPSDRSSTPRPTEARSLSVVAADHGADTDKTQGVRFGQMEQAILTVAGELFDQKGFNQTSLQDIADVLGMARPSLYHYFGNREQMLAAGTAQVTEQRDQILRELASTTGDPAQRLETLVLGLGHLISENPVWIRVVLRDDIALPDELREKEYRSRLAYFEALVRVLHEGVEQGFVRPLDERATAMTIIAALAGLRGHYLAASDPSTENATQLAADIILHGILEQDRQPGTPLERGLRLIDEGVKLIELTRE